MVRGTNPTRAMAAGIFDLNTPLDFFDSICRIFKRYKSSNTKEVEDLLYVIMGLNHLREWIAPGYDEPKKNPPQNYGEVFYQAIWDTKSFKTINDICNRTKHLSRKCMEISTQYGIPVDDWPDVDAVRDFDLGPASDYFVDGRNVIDIIDEVVEFYERKWFLKKTP
jgi:hypothetical protein